MALWVIAFYSPRTKPATLRSVYSFARDQTDPAAQDAAQSSVLRRIFRPTITSRAALLSTYDRRFAYDPSDPAAQDSARGTVPGLRFSHRYRRPRGLWWPLAPTVEAETLLFPLRGRRLRQVYHVPRGMFWPLSPDATVVVASFETTLAPIKGARLRQPFRFPRVYRVENIPPTDAGAVTAAGDIYVPILRRRRR